MTSTDILSALALTQLRLNVEEASRKAGRSTACPDDHDFFDPLEKSEDGLEQIMSELKLEGEFVRMRQEAANRFPSQDQVSVEERFRRSNWLGMKGLIVRAALWPTAADRAGSDRFARAAGIDESTFEEETYETLARRFLVVKEKLGFSEFCYWAVFAALTSMSDEDFNHFVEVADDMGLLFASELALTLHAEPLEARMKRKAESGGAPSVMYQAIPASSA